MDLEEILSKCDHTLLKQTATVKDIIALCQDAINFNKIGRASCRERV